VREKLLGLAALLLMPACALMPYESRFKCPEPKSGTCASVSEVYQASEVKQEDTAQPKAAGPMCLGIPSVDAGTPLRLPPRIVRLLVRPYTDSEGDLHQGGYVYLEVDKGRWLFERKGFKERILPIFKGAVPGGTADAGLSAPMEPPMASEPASDCPTCGKEE